MTSHPHNCMIDETPCKIIVQFDPHTKKLYGFSSMPRFVLLRNIDKDFNLKEFFAGLKINFDKKNRSEVAFVKSIELNDTTYFLGCVQFETHEDWHKAVDLNGKDDVVVETIPTFPFIPQTSAKDAIDAHFAEACAISRPRSTYIYLLAVNSGTLNKPVTELAVISTNNRYLQNQDHKLYTYNLIKMLNSFHVPVIQFVADGDARFRNHMLSMSGYAPKNDFEFSTEFVTRQPIEIMAEARTFGWEIPQVSCFDTFHFFVSSCEMERASIADYIESNPTRPYSSDSSTEVKFYLGLRCCSDVFCCTAPILGGIPRSCCQDQCHWLRKLIKSSLLSTKPLTLGNYTALFADICQVYEMGPETGLIKKDIDIHNKSDQKSVERIISESCLKSLRCLPWAKGTAFLVNLGKEAFKAWWKPDLSIITRLQIMYYTAKVISLWDIWVTGSGLDRSQCCITKELVRDTVVMACGMLHLCLTFKLYFPEMPFLPWKWSEYPLESYYSSIRFLNGNDDEFSTLEYLQRSKRNLTQQIIANKSAVKGNNLIFQIRKSNEK